MICPHCTLAIHETWSTSYVSLNGQSTKWDVRMMACPACHHDVLELGQSGPAADKQFAWKQIYPAGSNRGPVPLDVPSDIAADYNEAALVLPLSAKASAALSRRCLQSILRGAGYIQKDLSQQIDAALAEADTSKALPTGIHMIVDAIRNFGNFSAHKITDQTTLQVIDVQSHEAEYCLDVLDSLFDHYYTRPAQAKRMKEELNRKLAAAKKPPAK
jgi:hypothetical protein